MAREIDEGWIEEAIDRYRRIEALRAEFDKAVAGTEVTVRSPDESVEVVVSAAGDITDVRILGAVAHRAPADLAREMQAVVGAAADAARWAREKVHDEVFGAYRALGEH